MIRMLRRFWKELWRDEFGEAAQGCINKILNEMIVTTGVVIGRFQVPHLHEGHHHLISRAIEKNDKVVILIGCQKGLDKKNPLPYHVRRDMIKELYPGVIIHPLYDCNSDERWSETVDMVLGGLENPRLYGSRDSFVECYKGIIPYEHVEDIEGKSGTALREVVKIVNSEDFRRGMIWASKLRDSEKD